MINELKNILEIIKNVLFDKVKLYKLLMLGFVFLSLFVIIVQQVYPKYYKPKPLEGSFTPKEKPELIIKNWFDGSLQKQTEDYLNENFGFRNDFVRVNNEIKFLAFNKSSVVSSVIGKDNFLFDRGYIDAMNGIYYIGEGAINDTIDKIKFLQDTLAALDKTLLVVLAPSKPRIYPEYVPDGMIWNNNNNSFYETYVKGFYNKGVNFIDFNAIFQKKKLKNKYLLFPQLGVHWSRLEAVYALDTILSKITAISGKNLPRIEVTNIKEKDELESPDDDMIKSMNLFHYPKYRKMAYPEFVIKNNELRKQSALVVSDSYWWDIYLRDLPKEVFDNNEFWYYNKNVWGNNILGNIKANTIELKRHLLQNDVFIIMCTESNYDKMGFGFIGNAITALRKTIKPTAEELEKIKNDIEKNPEWKLNIQNTAKQKKISYNDALTENANWWFQKKGPSQSKITIESIKVSIKNNEQWMHDIRVKAKERKISIDSMINVDAVWYVENVLKLKVKDLKNN